MYLSIEVHRPQLWRGSRDTHWHARSCPGFDPSRALSTNPLWGVLIATDL